MYSVYSTVYSVCPCIHVYITSICLLLVTQVMTSVPNTTHLPRLLANLGMTPLSSPLPSDHTHMPLPVVLDGRIIGEVAEGKAKDLANKLRTLKCLGKEKVQ